MSEKADLESIASDEQHAHDQGSMTDDDNDSDITLRTPSFRPRWRKISRTSVYINYAALFFVLLVTGIAIVVLSTRSPDFSSTLLSGRENLLRPEHFWSDISVITQEFQPDTSLWRFDEVGDEAWLQRIQPDGDGFVVVPNARDYDIPPSSPTYRDSDPEGSEIFSLAVTHALHCLWSLRHVMVMRERRLHTTHDTDDHVAHCFDYIRFQLQCAGDTALEAGTKVCAPDEEGVRRCHYHFNPAGSRHVCKDWSQLSKRAEDMRYKDTVSARNYTRDFLPKHFD